MTNPSRAFVASVRAGLAREVVARLILMAFKDDHLKPPPEGGPSRASLVLGVTDRHIKRLLKQEHDAAWPIVLILLGRVGVEAALSLIFGEDG